MRRTTVLLGAGASADAGLPLTVQLAERVLHEANAVDMRDRGQDWLRALNFVYGSMVGYQSEDGNNPLQAVNIERLISAIRLLQDPKGHEVAPFVANWKAGALGMGVGQIDRALGKGVIKGVEAAVAKSAFHAEQELAESIAQIARAAAATGDSRAYVEAEQKVLQSLSRELADIGSVDYLRPIADTARAQPGGIDVLTLNYDLTIETMAAGEGVRVERGIEQWAPGRPMAFDQTAETIRLYKLHGSLDWRLETAGSTTHAPKISTRDTAQDPGFPIKRPMPWIVVGDREKLATDGPTLALLNAAVEALQRSQRLVVVGYSFSDAHINAMIRDWMSADSSRTIAIVDSNWEHRNLGEFRADLIGTYGLREREPRASRVIPLSGTAGQRLGEALQSAPLAFPEPYANGTVEELSDGVSRITATLLGPAVSDASAHASTRRDPADSSQFVNVGVDLFISEDEARAYDRNASAWGRSSWRTPHVDNWAEGQAISFYCRTPTVPLEELSVWASRLDARNQLSISVPLGHVASPNKDNE